jgi:hypothetical protein
MSTRGVAGRVLLTLAAGLSCAGCGDPPAPRPVAALKAPVSETGSASDDPAGASDAEEAGRRFLRRVAWLNYQIVAITQVARDDALVERLKLSPERKTELDAIYAATRGAVNRLGLASDDERRRLIDEEFGPAGERAEKWLAAMPAGELATVRRAVLAAQRGAVVYVMPGVAAELALSAEQTRAIEDIMAETQRKFSEIGAGGGLGLLKIPGIASAARAKADALLTDEQKRKFAALSGG